MIEENRESRKELIKKLPKCTTVEETRAITEAIKATALDDELEMKQQDIDLRVIAQQSDEELRKQEIKSANKRSFRQVAGEWVKGAFSVLCVGLGIYGTLAVNDRIMDRTENPDNPMIKKDPRVANILNFRK